VHKVAGAAAERWMSLEEVASIANLAASRVTSVGVALNSVTLPGSDVINDRLQGDMMEIGLGIHGEAGIRQHPMVSCKEIVDIMVQTIFKYGHGDQDKIEYLKPKDDVAVLVNNLGGTSNFEMSILTCDMVSLLEKEDGLGLNVVRVHVGAYMTSFDMQGVSLSVLCLDKENKLSELLDDETDAPAWSKADTWKPKNGETRPSLTLLPETKAPSSSSITATSPPTISIPNFTPANISKAIQSACNALIQNEAQITQWDTVVGDGDCGITMARGANEILSKENELNFENPIVLFQQLADAVSKSMGGTSGILFELMFRKISFSLSSRQENTKDVSTQDMIQAFQQGVNAISFYGGAKVGSRTMLDAFLPAVDVLVNGGTLTDMAEAARKGAETTKDMKEADAGRSNYLNEDVLVGTPDPGAMAVALVLEAISKVFTM